MILIYAVEKRPVTEGCGFVTDFCLICRAAQAFEVQRVGLAWSMSGVRLGKTT
ncbi:hypothetical protein [Xanthomonas floridensis]|uniref:Uncharacterized protein n=1 Tax=Xanthomonas floridensis TaxID=1843580 RepID=A0ABU5PZ89_9XANT|nr:hypothetical protein [Xanthomonas floridensis]MEA5124930.1 hypothetical protein [Xanthomonas floridensis]MEA5132522.1 hypothetical protein [Xanthomonas floridensis]